MFIVIDETDKRPIYLQVADEIKALIARGELAPGDTLPPVRQIAGDLGVNLNTIAAAYRDLQAEGLITVRHGSGAIVSARTASGQSTAEMRRPLRAALTQFSLAGLNRAEIMNIVADELKNLWPGKR